MNVGGGSNQSKKILAVDARDSLDATLKDNLTELTEENLSVDSAYLIYK